MASNVSNLLKEKIVTPVANSLATQVDNKVKNGIILRKFIGVQLGESNTGCQLVKIDLNKINVKDPSYEFTLYIKAFSQKGLFNFIVNVNKTDSLQVDVKCEVKNSDSNNGEAIGYYDVDAVGNTITVSLMKDFVVNTSINECKFVSTKDTLMISDLDIDWSDTGNVKTTSSINIRYNQTSIYEYDEYFYPYKPDFADGEMYQIAKFDFSELLNKTLTGNKNFDIIIDIIYHSIGEFHICFDLSWMRNLSMINMIHGVYEKIPSQSSMEGRNFDELFKFCRKDNTTLLLLINPPAMYISGGHFVIRRIEVHRANADIESDLVKIDLTPEKLVNSNGSLVIGSIKKHTIDFTKVFTPSDSDNDVMSNGVVPYPTTSEAENKYLLGADAKWHPRKSMNDSFVELVPDDTIKGLDIEDITKAVSFVTFDFTNIIAKLTELSKSSTSIPFEMNLRTARSGDHHIDGNFTVNKSGLIPTTAFITPLSTKGAPIGYLENPSEFYGEVIDNPCFYIMDNTLKTVTFALYTPFADSSVCIKDFYIHIDESIASLSDILIEWKLIAIDKPEWAPLKVQKFINGSLIPPTRIFEQMNIETPIDEADSFTLEKERVKNNGLVPAPGKYEVDNGYVLGADAKWHPRKAGNEYIANLKPTEEIKGLSETDTTKGISFVTIDFNSLSQKVVESTPSTSPEFMIHMKVLTRNLGIITISSRLTVNTNGLIGCSGVLSDRGMGSNSVSFSTTYSGKLGAVVSPGFFVNDTDTKILKIALYTPIAINGVKIIDAGVTSYSDIIDESDIVFTWELGILEKKPYKPLRSNIIYPRIDLDRELVFDQMNIETPISETDEDTLFAEQIKHNGLVPAPGKYEVNNQYFLKADGTWDLPKNSINDYIALVTPSEEMVDQTGTTTGVSFVTIDYSKAYEKLSLGTNETTGFRLYLTIFNERYGKLEISLRTIIVNLGENINQGVIAYADIGTGGSSVQLGQVQSNYGEDIRTPIFTDIDPTTHKIRVGIYAVGTNKPVIVKNCTIHQTHDTIDTHDINILWEASVVTFSEENTTSASQYINMNWNRAFSPILWMMNPEGSYSDSQVRKWRSDYNGFVPAPAKYEADQGRVLCADGSWIPTRGNNNSVSVVTPSEEMTSQVSSTVGITFVTFDYSKIIESLSLAVNTGSGFEGILVINTKLFGEILINFNVNLFNLDGTINKNATAYANVGTKSADHNSQISVIQNTYGADIKTPVFIYTDSVNNICKIGLYGTASKSPVIIKDCTLNQTYTDFDVNDITITWEPTTITISEENTNDASIFTNMDWSKIFTPIANMTDPDGSYGENNIRRWKLQNNGLVPAPTKYEADQDYVLHADGTWKKVDGNASFTPVPITLDSTKYQEAYETQSNPDSSKKTVLFMNIDLSDFVITGSDVAKIELSLYSVIYGRSTLVIDTMINGISNQYCVSEDANGSGYYLDYILSVLQKNPSFTGKDEVSIESFYTFMIDGDIIRIGISPIIFSLYAGTVPPFAAIIVEDCKIIRQSVTSNSVTTEMGNISINYDQTTNTLSNIYGANRKGWVAKNTVFSDYNDADPRDFQSLHNGLVPAPTREEAGENKFLKADGSWQTPPSIRVNDNYIAKVERDSSMVEQVSATKATSFLTIDYSTICEQIGAATGDGGQADSNIFTSLEVMVPVWGKIQISIVSFLSDNWFNVIVYSDAGTGWYTDNIAYKIHSDISDNELHTRPGFYIQDDVNKTVTLGMYGSYGTDEIAIIDCTSIAVGEGFSVDDMIYNYDRQLIDIPESADDFDEIGITRNTVFQSMAYADTDPDGSKYLYQRGSYNGLVPAPAKYDVTHNYMLRPNGTWGPIEGIIRNRTFTVTPYTDSSSTQTNDYAITEGAEDLASAINENYSVDINIVFSGLGSKNNTNTTLRITGVTGTINLYDCSGNPIKYITDGMSMKCTIFKNTIDDPVESMNAYCMYDIVSYPNTINGPSE